MSLEIKIPSVGESVQEAVLAEWFKTDGEQVTRDEPILVIETDKVTLEVVAEADGTLKILIQEGETVAIGAVVGLIELGKGETVQKTVQPEPVSQPAAEEVQPEPQKAAEAVAPAKPDIKATVPLAPSVRRLIAEKNLDPEKIPGTGPGDRISKGDVLLYLEQAPAGVPDAFVKASAEVTPVANIPADVVRKPMSPIRKRIAARLLESKQSTAMLTTFNEIDMHQAMAMRARYKEMFQKKHGVSLGFMSIFIKACVEALKEIPEINAFIDGENIVYHNYQHIGVAVGTERGLVVPVIRHAEKMSFAQMEKAIVEYVTKIKENRLELADLEGGTFTVSNGGVYGSLLSTPILNTPQSGILGMHKN